MVLLLRRCRQLCLFCLCRHPFHLCPPIPLLPPDDPSTRSFTSPAEQTMQRYQQSSSVESDFPVDPIMNFQSTYRRGFAGCMFCGDVHHVYRQCPSNGQPTASALFYKNLFAHKPHLQKRAPLPEDMLPPVAPGTPPTQSFLSAPADTTPVIASVPNLPAVSSPPLQSSLKKARFMLLHVSLFRHTFLPLLRSFL